MQCNIKREQDEEFGVGYEEGKRGGLVWLCTGGEDGIRLDVCTWWRWKYVRIEVVDR